MNYFSYFRSNQLYYRKPISKVNFESFFRFFIQIGIDYIEPKYLAEAEEVREKILIRDKIAIKEFGDLAFMSGIGGIICVLYDDLDEIIW